MCESRSHAPTSRFLLLFLSSPRPPPPHSFPVSLSFSLYPLLPRAILSSRICDHQHAKWIKFLDYTFRRPLSLPVSDSYTRSLAPRRSSLVATFRIAPTISQIVSPHTYEYLYRLQYPPPVSPPVLPSHYFRFFFETKALLSFILRSPPVRDLSESGRGFTAYSDPPLQLFWIYRSSREFS